MKPKVSVLITDLDNTLYDWVDIWYNSFSPFLDKLAELSNVPREKLISEIQTIFQKHGTTEYAFLLEEIPSLLAKHRQKDIPEIYEDCINAYRTGRKNSLKLYPEVLETLCLMKSRGCLIVGYTESKAFYSF